MDQKTHVVGTLRKHREYYSSDVKTKVLKRGELIAKETTSGVTVVKWNDKKEVLMLTTCHKGNETKDVKVRNRTVKQPVCKLDYDIGKCSVDLSDQLASYSTAVRKSTKWYRKIIVELIWGTSLVNAHHLYCTNNVTNGPISSITDFKMSIIQSLAEQNKRDEIEDRSSRPSSARPRHRHIQHPEKKRARCVGCYEIYGRNGTKQPDGRTQRASVVWNICNECQVHYCKKCFNAKH